MAGKTQRNYDHLLKVILIGNSGVGKPALMVRFHRLHSSPDQTLAFQAWVEFVVGTLDVDGERVKLQVWDTAGQERFRTITSAYYRGTQGILLVYDVKDRGSFDSISGWLSSIAEHSEGLCKILVGNNNDDPDRKVVTTEEAQSLAEQNGMQLFEINSQDDSQVEQMFLALARMILKTKKEKAPPEAPTTLEEGKGTQSKCAVM
ncbi:ras-related protein Rab-35-like [Babylonia areolata]|uniref:ras-related protein Rab-35-like n=1 Tax=Babylonia areolata TaxID=304850 RepID=UPI003FD1A590